MSDDADEQEVIETARILFAGPISFLKSAPDLRYLPEPDAPEVAFAGRSNVGKSSLLNRLTNRAGLARTSNTPGRTQELNFFDVGAPEEGGTPVLRLVDMPGYGFAKAPKDIVRKWRHVVNDYLRGRVVLRRALVLIDARHGIKEVDREIMTMLDKAAVTYHVVLTKADKIKASELAAVTERTAAEARTHVAAHPRLIVTSSEKDMGIAELRAAILEAIRS
jgi:GTP-binding protein